MNEYIFKFTALHYDQVSLLPPKKPLWALVISSDFQTNILYAFLISPIETAFLPISSCNFFPAYLSEHHVLSRPQCFFPLIEKPSFTHTKEQVNRQEVCYRMIPKWILSINAYNLLTYCEMWKYKNSSLFSRVLKTPTEEIWPGVSQLPDYKTTFPNWTQYNLMTHVKNIEEDGLDLLKVTARNSVM